MEVTQLVAKVIQPPGGCHKGHTTHEHHRTTHNKVVRFTAGSYNIRLGHSGCRTTCNATYMDNKGKGFMSRKIIMYCVNVFLIFSTACKS
jgi:hypothetical protein